MGIIQKTSDGLSKVTILVYHQNDNGIEESLSIFRHFSRTKEISDVLGLVANNQNEEAFAFILENGLVTEVNLDRVIASCDNLERIELVTVSTSGLSPENQSQLREVSRSRFRNLQISAPQGSRVREHRLYFPAHQNFGDPREFITGEADSRLVIIPEDRRSDSAFSQQVNGFGDPTYFWHVAAELISICGLWVTVKGCVFEKIDQYTAGTRSPVIQVVRSFARTANSPVTTLMNEYESSEEIPIPSGLIAAPDPFYLTEQAAETIYDYDFQLRPANTFVESRQNIESKSLLRRIFRRIWGDLKALRRTLFKGYSSNFNDLVDEFAQGLIGDNSWLSCLPKPLDESSSRVTKDEIDEAIAELERSVLARREVVWSGEDRWPLVLRQTLGVIDGNDLAEEIRKETGNSRWVAVDRKAVGNGYSEDLGEVVKFLVNHGDSDSETNRREPKGLLQLISEKFHRETIKSLSRCEELLNKIRELKPEGEFKETEGVSKTVTLTFYVALFAMVISVLVFPPFIHQVLDFTENWNATTKQTWFWFLTILPAASAALFFSPIDSKKRQNFMLGFSAVYVIFGFVIFGFIPGFDSRELNEIPNKYFIAFLVAIGLLVVSKLYFPHWFKKKAEADEGEADEGEADEAEAGVAEADEGARTLEGTGDKWTVRGKWLMEFVLPPYAFLLVVVALNNEDLLRRGFIENESGKLGWGIFVFSLIMFLVSFVIIDIIRQREETNLLGWKAKYHWYVNETRHEFQNFKIVETFEHQWLGIASVLVRLLEFPYGKGENSETSPELEQLPTADLQKLQATALELTDAGREQFQGTAKSELIAPGWLTNNYEKMSRAFLNIQTDTLPRLDDQDITLPESCPYPVNLDEAVNGSARGRRWPFCYEVFAGEFDKELRESAEKKLTEILLKTFIENPDSYKVASPDSRFSSSSSNTLGESFGEILPSGKGVWVPAVFGTAVDINYNIQDSVESFVWWPKVVEFPSHQALLEDSIFVSENYVSANAVIVQAVRIDLSNTIKLDDFYIREKDYGRDSSSSGLDSPSGTEW